MSNYVHRQWKVTSYLSVQLMWSRIVQCPDSPAAVVVVVVVVVVVEIFVHGAVKATVTNAPQSRLNKRDFSSFLNWPTVVSDWRSEAGRLFQSPGPATWKAQSPKPVMCECLLDDDRVVFCCIRVISGVVTSRPNLQLVESGSCTLGTQLLHHWFTVLSLIRVPTPSGKSWIFFLENSRTWKITLVLESPGN